MNHFFMHAPKWRTGAGVLTLLAWLTSCGPNNKAVEYPLIETANTNALDIAKVELTDSATILHTDAYYRPHNWIRISSESYLQAGGKRYMLTGAEGITPDSLFWMPESGEASFTLCFEPLPSGTTSFDFIESDCEDCFKLFGIDLTGKKTFDIPDDVPESLRLVDWDAEVPEPIFKTGTTTVNVHFLHYRPELGKEANLYVNTLFGTQQPYTATVDPETGKASFSFLQCGTVQAAVVLNNSMAGSAWLAPGETTELYVDMHSIGYYLSLRREEKKKITYPAPFQRLYSSGTYANLNNVDNQLDNSPYYSMNSLTGEFADYHMTSAEYAAHVVDTYKALADSIARSNFSLLKKEMKLLALRQDAFSAMAQGDYLREHNYRHINRQWDYNFKVEGIAPLKPADAKAICQLFDINDTKLLMGENVSDYVRAACSSSFDWPQLADIQKGLVKDLRQIAGYPAKAENIALTDSDFVRLQAMDNHFYIEAFTLMQKKAKEELAAVEAKSRVETTPDVPKERLFDALIAPYKGKVVIVDFWNTWCGPCRAAIQANEPLKSSNLKSDNLVWVYIANETSPIVKYKTMIPDIQGLHYRLNQEQWNYLCDKFKIDGIPSYVLVDKSGAYKLRNDFRDHSLMIKTLIEELEK